MLVRTLLQWLLLSVGLLALPAQAQRVQPPRPRSSPALLCWREGQRLTWADFRAVRCYGKECRYSSYVGASTLVDIPMEFVFGADSVVVDYRVGCQFLRDSSWANPDMALALPARQAYILAHEQVHFDTAELVARKVRRRVAELRAAGTDLTSAAAAADLQCLLDEYDPLGALYHDAVEWRPPAEQAAGQRRWEQIVARELRALAAYKFTPATCVP